LKRIYEILPQLNVVSLYRNYLTLAIRNLWKEKLYAFLNVSGLAMGIACMLTVFTYVDFERKYDRFHVNGNRIYRVTESFVEDGQLVEAAINHAPLAGFLEDHLAGVKEVIRILPISDYFNVYVKSGPREVHKEAGFCFGDPSLFRSFSFSSLAGSPEQALRDPSSVVITREMAVKYFGSVEAAMGSELQYSREVCNCRYTGSVAFFI
jgi:putative ABC transport system permease protein